MKLWKKVIERRLIKETQVTKNQFWFYAWEFGHGRDISITKYDKVQSDRTIRLTLNFY